MLQQLVVNKASKVKMSWLCFEDPDAPLIVKMIPSMLKLPTIVKLELKEGEESTEKGEEEDGMEEVMEEDMSEDAVVLDEEDTVDRPEVLKAVEMLQESSKQQLAAYNHLVEAIQVYDRH